MGVDFYPCSKCDEVFGDCGDYKHCDGCGAYFCGVCMDEGVTFRDPERDDDDDDDECICCSDKAERRAIVTDDTLVDFIVARHGYKTRAALVEVYKEAHTLGAALDAMARRADAQAGQQWREEMRGFELLFAQFLSERNVRFEWSRIRPPADHLVVAHGSLATVDANELETCARLLTKVAVVKLNGGLGTSMGCQGPKSKIEVRAGMTFLDLCVKQVEHLNKVYSVDVPLLLMNSFNTAADTRKIVAKYAVDVDVRQFNQRRFPRISKDDLLPVGEAPFAGGDDDDDDDGGNDVNGHFYPPGHGDVFVSLQRSGELARLRAAGVEYVFVSNIDNLGATVDLGILRHVIETGADFVMEVTPKTRADVKGGTLIEYDGKLRLFEIAQCPSAKIEEFKSVKKFKIFNTNNIWVKLEAIESALALALALAQDGGGLKMDVIVNEKVHRGQKILQLECAVGAAIQGFAHAHAVSVPRSRFLPVKNTSDLLIVQSSIYELASDYSLRMDERRPFAAVPLVKLGPLFNHVAQYQARVPHIPDISELDHLTLSGDVTFGAGVTLRGAVIVVAGHDERIDIPDGAILENKVVSGSLRIVEH